DLGAGLERVRGRLDERGRDRVERLRVDLTGVDAIGGRDVSAIFAGGHRGCRIFTRSCADASAKAARTFLVNVGTSSIWGTDLRERGPIRPGPLTAREAPH